MIKGLLIYAMVSIALSIGVAVWRHIATAPPRPLSDDQKGFVHDPF